jgi:hypothetical protein
MSLPTPSWAEHSFDVVVAGATPAGCAAAITAARAGASVLLLEPTAVVGGMNANGVHAFDTASQQALGGLSEEFAAGVRAYYRDAGVDDPLLASESDLYWEGKVAARVWRGLLDAERRIITVTGAVPVGAEVARGTVRAIIVAPAADARGTPEPGAAGWPARGRVFIDASYEGDVAAWSGANFNIGRERRSVAEPHAGLLYTTYLNRQPANGWLPQTVLPGSSGESDDRIMAFNCRLTCRVYPSKIDQERRRLRTPPPGYDPTRYSWRREHFLPGGVPRFGTGVIPSVRGKVLLNVMNGGNDLAEGAREYVLAHPRDRGPLRQRFIDHAVGYLYYIQTRGESPEVALAHDEYEDHGGVPLQIYVREGRRVVGDCWLDEGAINPHLQGTGYRPPLRSDAIAVGDWAIESKKCADATPADKPWAEGLIHARGVRAPYQVPFGCLVPQGVENLLVACAISASHVAYSAIRVESTWTQLGVAAGYAAQMAAAGSGRVRDVALAELQGKLVAAKAKLTYFADVESSHPHFAAIQWLALRGEVPHDRGWRFLAGRSISWGEFIAMTVRAFAIPASVTGSHFEGVEPGDPFFRDYESVYDLASRAGVAVFPGLIGYREDPGTDHTRAEARTRWLRVPPDEPVSLEEALRFIGDVRRAQRGADAGQAEHGLDTTQQDGGDARQHHGIDAVHGPQGFAEAILSRAAAAQLLYAHRNPR